MDSDQVSQLVTKFLPKLMQVAQRKLNDPEQAHDVVNDLFTKILENPKISMGSPRRFLLRAITYACIDRNKADKRESSRRKKYRIFQAPPELEEMREELEREINLLPVDQREVFVLKTDTTLSFEEVGEALEISASTAESRYRTARETLKARMMKSQEAEK